MERMRACDRAAAFADENRAVRAQGHAGLSNEAVAFVPQQRLRGLGCLHVAAQLNDIVVLGR